MVERLLQPVVLQLGLVPAMSSGTSGSASTG
jgi:hypothetical protein